MQLGRVRRRPSQGGTDIRRKHRPDYWLPMVAISLLVIGLVVVYAISPGVSAQKGVSEGYYVSKQIIAIILGIAAFVALSRVPYRMWRSFVVPLMVVAAIAAVAVRAFGEQTNGAYRWIQVGGLSFQAAELIKFSMLIWLADFLARRRAAGDMTNLKALIKPLVIAVVTIFVVVAWQESDLGSTAVMMGMMAAMVFLAGLPMRQLLIGGGGLVALILIFVVIVITATPYRRARMATFFNPASDCQASGYQSCQALIAVGSGGMFGLGLGRSVQAYGYLPEANNDSIFAILAEKFGFVGVTLIIALYGIFFTRLKRVIERAPDDFSRLLVAGILAWFSVQAFINIGAMIGLLPLKGITLPFVSYGGTSLLFVTGALGIVFQISRYSALTLNGNQHMEDPDEDRTYRRGNGRPRYTALSRR